MVVKSLRCNHTGVAGRGARGGLGTLSTVIIGLLGAAGAGAADAPAPAGDSNADLMEVVVTAQRRSENIEKVPMSVQAFSQVTLDRLQIQTTDQLQFATPGFVNTQTSGDGISAIYIRGVGTGYSGPGLEGSVAMYIDDVYLQTQTSSSQQTIDVAQVQVLKGPQGTLYGRNATGGAVVITTNDPKLDAVSGYAKVLYGSLNWTREESVINTPLSSTVANRMVQYYQYRDGYVNNVALPQQQKSGVGAGDTWGFRDKLLWQPIDDFRLVGTVEYDRRAGNGAIHSLRYNGDGSPTGLGYYQTQQSLNMEGGGGDDTDDLNAIVHAEYNLNKFKFSNTFAFRRARAFGCTDNDGVVAQELYFCTVSQRSPNPGDADGKIDNTFTDEFRVTAEGLGPFDGTAGAFIEKNKARFVGRIEGSFFGAALPTFDNHDDLSAYSAFIDVNYHVFEGLKVTAGVRYTDEQKYHSVSDDADTIAILAPTGVDGAGSVFGSQNVSFVNFSPRAVVAYEAGPMNYYASFNRGFKSGGFNSPGFGLAPVLKPETITAYEIGAKYRSDDGTLRASGAVFNYLWKNQQVAFITGGGTGIQQQNAAGSKIYGAELDVDYAPVDAWLFSTGLGYTHARYTDFTNAAVYNLINGGLTATAENLNGQRLPQAPDYTANASATYRLRLPQNWGANLVLGARYTSQADFSPGAGGELGADRQKAYTLVNTSAIFTGPDEHLQLRFFITNLTGVKYISLTSTGNTGVYQTPAEPRLVGVSAQYSF